MCRRGSGVVAQPGMQGLTRVRCIGYRIGLASTDKEGSWVAVVGPRAGEGGPQWAVHGESKQEKGWALVEENERGRGGTLGQPEKNGPRGLGKRKNLFPIIKTFYDL
jgi:hypothetical protein